MDFEKLLNYWIEDIYIQLLDRGHIYVLYPCSILIHDSSSFVCGSYLSLGIFLNRFPLHIMRRENSVFPYFSSFPMNFLKEGQGAKEGKVLNCTHTLPLRKTSEKGTEK